MKSKHLLLTLLLALFAPWASQAQETLTVYEEATETSEYVPFYGYYADESQQDQMIYPASELTAMVGMEIIQMVFYIDDKDGSRDIGEWIVSLGETTATTLSGLDLTTPLTEVYSGKMIFNSDETLMTVTFANGYIYNGGNLLVEFNHPVTESYKHYYFLGVEATGASYCYDEQQNFLPKVTFSYQNPPACPKPTGVTATAPTAHGATVSWTGSSDSYILILGQASTFGSYNFESNSIPAAFTNSTSYPWTVVANTHSGGYCVKSGNAGVNSTTSDLVLEVNLTSAGSVSFSALASSESNWDFGRFLIDGAQQFQTSGTTNSWADYSFDLAAGSHTLTWSFEKDSGGDYGDDCFYVDDIKINLNPTTWDETHTASASPYTFTDLDTETSYLVMVKGVCGSEQSEPSAAARFTTLVSCPAPQNLTVTTDNVTATATWTGTEGTCNIDINGTVTNDVTSPYTFNVELSTTYNVKVQANCEGETSSWTAPFTFTTPDCIDGHTIEYTLTDSWGDGWTDNAILLKDACDVLETLTIANGYTNSGTLTLCGDYYQLTWQTGEYADETSFTLIVDGAAIYTNQSGENLSDGQVLYTIGTAPTMLPKPTDLTAGTPESRSVELSWTENGEATTWELCVNGDESNPVAANSNPFTLTDLTPDTDYTVKVRSTDGTNVSCWSDEITFITDVACPAPTNLTVTNLMPTSATLNWEGEAENYNVRYGVAGGEVAIFEDGFENGLDNWTVISNGEYTQLPWMQFNVDDFGNSDYTNHNGSYVAMSRSYTGSADVSVDNWLITPQVTLDGDLKYWVINDDNFGYAEQYAIYVSTTGNSINDFTLLYTPGNNTTWTEHVVDLRSFNGALGYIAIRHQDYAKDFLLIDDFGIYATQGAGEWTNTTSTTNSLDITGLTPETNYVFQVQANCGSEDGMSQWSTIANFTTPDACAAPTGLTAEVTGNAAELSWTGATDTYNLQYLEVNPTEPATIILNVPNDVWGDGSGYQMLIDADATAYDDGDFSDYSIFEYLIPTDATYDPNTTGIVINNSVTIQIPAGTYDWMITNPSPDYSAVYVAGSNGNVNGAEDNFVFEAGKTYEFTLYLVGSSVGDGVNLTITDNDAWTLVEGVTSPYTLENLSPQTTYQYQVQGVDCDGNGGTTDWSASANFTTLKEYVWVNENGGVWNELNEGEEPTASTDLDLPANSVLIIPDGVNAVVDEITLGNNSEIIIEDGGQLHHTNVVPVTLQLNIDGYNAKSNNNGGYRLISVPVYTNDNETLSVEGTNLNSGEYDLYYFDQEEEGEEWRNYKAEPFDLTLGMGYLYANEEDINPSFTGNTIPTDGEKAVAVVYYSDKVAAGVNLLGNPFTCNAYIDRSFYRLNSAGSELEAESSDDAIKVMEGVFVYADDNMYQITFTTTEPAGGKSALNIMVNQGHSMLDKAIVNFNNGSTLRKFQLNPNHTKVYMPVEGQNYAIANAESQMGEMPVSFEAETNGTYSFDFSADNVDFSYLHLIDNMTGADVDLLATPSYSFNATTADYASRFRLVFATGSSLDGDNFGFINGMGNLSIFGIEGEATLQVMDVTGRILSSETFSGSYEKKLNAAPGVYMLRLINGNDVKVQKIVIR